MKIVRLSKTTLPLASERVLQTCIGAVKDFIQVYSIVAVLVSTIAVSEQVSVEIDYDQAIEDYKVDVEVVNPEIYIKFSTYVCDTVNKTPVLQKMPSLTIIKPSLNNILQQCQ